MLKVAQTAHDLSQQKEPLSPAAAEAIKETMDYSPWYIDAQPSRMSRPLPMPWALGPVKDTRKSSMELLDLEIESFGRYAELSPAEKVARESVIVETNTFISKTITKQMVETNVFGSEKTGLATATSDIDFRLSWSSRSRQNSSSALSGPLKHLAKAMSGSPEYEHVEFRFAKYPLIAAKHKKSGIDIQIVSSPDTRPQRDVTAQYLTELPHLRSVYMVVKTALSIRGLVDVYSGGTGSYGLFIMLVAALKRRSSDPPTTAAAQLLRFLDFYTHLNTEKHAISVSQSKLFMKHDASEVPLKDNIEAARRRGDAIRAAQWAIGQKRLHQPYLLCLQDPAKPSNDLGRKSNAVKHIQRTLKVLYNTLQRDLEDIQAAQNHGKPWQHDSILEPHVGRCHEVYFERRRKVEEYGLKSMLETERTSKAGQRVAKEGA
ncbi:hypothetical protein LTR37_005452 [Vermiconidia calcicola]|uniref:Uncharacterized protein n=1 Tax=Vermiconidia calcicola TaxID=1690605 RepID=A0ACC3NL18_9PEZI|nr:hypothetical protein LTR37_005452 [Vermiconidia calcicola]